MGRKTWDSLPIKPLPNRKNIVISSTKQTGVDSYKSIDACMEYLQKINHYRIFLLLEVCLFISIL